jgi:predicted DNA-binding transcriptional regulator AlpA
MKCARPPAAQSQRAETHLTTDHPTLSRRQFGRRYSTAPVQPGDCTSILPEFGRTPEVTRLFGLKRGTLYNLLRDGKIRGCVLRSRGMKSGCRLWDLASVREFIFSQMAVDGDKEGNGDVSN